MKTIKQIADEIGVSKQAIQKRISHEPLYTNIKPFLSTVGGIRYIDVGGENLIKSAYQNNNRQPVADNLPTNQATTTDNQIIKFLQQQLEIKDKQIDDMRRQLEEERTHSRELAARSQEQADKIILLVEQGQEIAKNAQTLQAYESAKQPPPLVEESKSKRNIFNFFKKNNK